MGLAELQRLLLGLYEDRALRDRFFASPEAVAAEFDLPPAEIWTIAQISPDQVNFFAESLRSKRMQEVARYLPESRRSLGPEFEVLFSGYADSVFAGQHRSRREDALGFVDYILGSSAAKQLKAPWIRDVLRYEAAWVAIGVPRRRLIVRLFPVWPRVPRGISVAWQVSKFAPQWVVGIWFRATARGRPHHAVLTGDGFYRRERS